MLVGTARGLRGVHCGLSRKACAGRVSAAKGGTPVTLGRRAPPVRMAPRAPASTDGGRDSRWPYAAGPAASAASCHPRHCAPSLQTCMIPPAQPSSLRITLYGALQDLNYAASPVLGTGRGGGW